MSIAERYRRCINLLSQISLFTNLEDEWASNWILAFKRWSVQELVMVNDKFPLKDPSLTLDAATNGNQSLQQMIHDALAAVEEFLKGVTDPSWNARSALTGEPTGVDSMRHKHKLLKPAPFYKNDDNSSREPTRSSLGSDSDTKTNQRVHSSVGGGTNNSYRVLLDQTLENLEHLSTLSRRGNQGCPLPSRFDCPELFSNSTARLIYLRAWDTVKSRFPLATAEIHRRLAVGLSITVSVLVQEERLLSATVEANEDIFESLESKSPLRMFNTTREMLKTSDKHAEHRHQQKEDMGSRRIDLPDDTNLPIPPRESPEPVSFPTPSDQETESSATPPAIVYHVCTLASCKDPYTRYQNRSDWERHIRVQHRTTPAWVCPARGHKDSFVEFKTRSEMADHLIKDHRAHASGVDYLVRACECPHNNTPEQCCLCLRLITSDPDDAGKGYLEHTSGHFTDLAEEYELLKAAVRSGAH